MAERADDPRPPRDDAALARRAQILATEHWGLLAARGTAQNEVLARITIHLALVSAGLVSIGLLGQATGFDGAFRGAMIAILGFLALIGWMTQLRVLHVGEEDLMYVIAMNRLRGAYVDLDPEVERYFLAGVADDERGAQRTYSFLRVRRDWAVVIGSSMMLIIVVQACVAGLLVGAALVTAGAALGWAVTAGAAVALVWAASAARRGHRHYRTSLDAHRPLRSSPLPPAPPVQEPPLA